jgi:hypothetical protein
MVIVETSIDIAHLELIKIFFQANDLIVVLDTVYKPFPNRTVELPYISIKYDNDGETAVKLSYMAMVHSGFNNMLEDYLLKCGISARHISPPIPPSAVTDEDLEDHLTKIGLRNVHINA